MATYTSVVVVSVLFHTLNDGGGGKALLLLYFTSMLVLLPYFTHAALLGSLPVTRTLSVGYIFLPDNIRDSYSGFTPP